MFGFLDAFNPVVHKGEGQNAEPYIPHTADPAAREEFTKGAQAAWIDYRNPPADFYRHSKDYQRGFMVIRRLIVEGDEAGAQRVIAVLRHKPKKRYDPGADERYLVRNRGPQGSGRGSFKTEGGPRGTVKQVASWFALGHPPPYRSNGGLWVGRHDVAYSYNQKIAEKHETRQIAYVDMRDFSPTTNRHRNALVTALTRHGWQIEPRGFR